MVDKRLERWYVEQLRRTVEGFPSGEILAGESPDFVIRSGDSSVGIEVTVLHLPPADGKRPHQEQQSLKDRIVRRACQIHADGGGPALYVSVYFRDEPTLSKATVPNLSQRIAEALLQFPAPVSLDDGWKSVPPLHLPKEIVKVNIAASVDGQDLLWTAGSGGWIAQVQPRDIESVISDKANMFPVAKSKCDDVWLVIVNDEFCRAAPAELSEFAAGHVYTHPFTRLVWLEPHRPIARDLGVVNG